MSTDLNRRIVERFDNLIGANSPDESDELNELCAPDMVNHALAPGRPQGLAGTREFLSDSVTRYGDTGWSRLNVIAGGDFVVHHGHRGGTYRGGPLLGFDPHPGPYNREVVFLYHLNDGRITERWVVRDDLTMLRQLGGIPALP